MIRLKEFLKLIGSVLRRFREVREICNMESKISVSKYTKKE